MRGLFIALYSEGPTDNRFLPSIIQRTVERILRKYTKSGSEIDTPPIYIVSSESVARQKDGARKILSAAQEACYFHLLIVHKDADAQKHREVLKTRFYPGRELVNQVAPAQAICRNLIPIIPVRMTEAWMLVDCDALLAEIGTNMSVEELKRELSKRSLSQITLPAQPHQVAKVLDPKQIIEQIIRITSGRRRIHLNDLYEPVAKRVDLQKLAKVTAYEQFTNDLIQGLIDLRFMDYGVDDGRDKTVPALWAGE